MKGRVGYRTGLGSVLQTSKSLTSVKVARSAVPPDLLTLRSPALKSEKTNSGSSLLSGFAEGDGKVGFAFNRRIVECIASAVPFGGLEEKSVLQAAGKAGEAALAVDIGANLEIELVGVEEPVGDADVDLGGVDGLAGRIGDREVSGTGPESSIDSGGGVWVGGVLGDEWSEK